MNEVIEFISQPWPWFVAGPVIAVVMLALIWFGETFGISSNLKTMCSILGAGKSCEYFNFDWRNQRWNLVFAGGLIIGGFISDQFLMPAEDIQLSSETIAELKSFGLATPGKEMVPQEIFNWQSLTSLKGFIFIVVGGFCVGFGSRYAGGCTSGHAISGLSNLQVPSLIAVIGFFIGGLMITYLVLPWLLIL
jgi:uncharacterized membrane protein YedE/YeeE